MRNNEIIYSKWEINKKNTITVYLSLRRDRQTKQDIIYSEYVCI